MSNTLVIHLEDKSTDSLKLVYKDIDCDVIRSCDVSDKEIRNAIKSHDRIIMLGHGTPMGLINPKKFGYVINGSHAELFKDKDTFSIWCNSDQYFRRYGLHGFHTGMIISEISEERWVLGYVPLNKEELEENKDMFSNACAGGLNLSPADCKEYVLAHYIGDDPVTQYNRSNVIVL